MGTPLRIWLFLPGTVAPAIVALWLDRSSLDGVFKWQVSARWYAFAFLYIGVVKLAAALTHRLVAGAWPAIESGPWLLFIAGTVVSTPVQAGEEIGWRGFALPRLAQGLGLGSAALVLGVIWAAWHLPLFFIAGTDTTGQSFPLYLLTVIAISVAIAWLYARTAGSLLPVMLLHAAANNMPHFIPSPATGKVWALNASLIQWLTLLFLWIGASYFLLRMRHSGTSHEHATAIP